MWDDCQIYELKLFMKLKNQPLYQHVGPGQTKLLIGTLLWTSDILQLEYTFEMLEKSRTCHSGNSVPQYFIVTKVRLGLIPLRNGECKGARNKVFLYFWTVTLL